MRRGLTVSVLVWSMSAPAMAAGNKATAVPVSPQVVKTTGDSPEGYVWEAIDFNGDGVVEVKSYYQKRTDGPKALRKREVDLNRDGRVDVITTFDELGNREKEEMDGDFDGKVDMVDIYVAGKRQSSQVDTDYNGSFDLFRYYEGGKVRRKERDTNLDGKIDFMEQLDENGVIVKIGRDEDGDGDIDVRQ